MTLLKIAQIGHPVLRQEASPVTPQELASAEIQSFIDDLIETMRHARGAGLAANQVHRPIQICAIEVSDNPRYPYKPNIPLTVLVNPEIHPISDAMIDVYEGCLSVPDLRGRVLRHAEIDVRALDRHGKPISQTVHGLSAATFQHEVDHLRGSLFVDRVQDPKTLTTWAEFSQHQEAAFVAEAEAIVARYGG